MPSVILMDLKQAMSSNGSTSTSRISAFSISTRGALILIVLLSIVLRVWGLDFGLPQSFHPDEPVVVTRAQYGVVTNDWNPRAFHWPSLQIYLLGMEYEIWYLVGRVAGYWETGDPEFISYALHYPSGFYYLGRFTTVLFGAACVWLTFLIARRFLREPGALAAAATVALHPLMIRHSRLITPDIPSEFFFLAALFYIDRLHQSFRKQRENASSELRPIRLCIIAAAMVGLGAGTKYPVGVLAVPLLATVLFASSPKTAGARMLPALWSILTILVAFLVTTPFALLDWPRFINDIRTIGWHVKTGHIGMEAVGGIWMASLGAMVKDSGWIWLVSGATGAVMFLFTDPRRTWPLILAFALPIIGLAPLNVFSDRYLVPLVPLGALGIGWWIDGLLRWSGRLGRGRSLHVAVVAIVFLVIISKGIGVFSREGYNLTLPDTREAAYGWVIQNIPGESKVLVEQGGPDLNPADLAPLVPEPWYEITEITPLFSRGGRNKDPLFAMVEARPEWVITSSQVRSRYMREGAEREYRDLVAAFREYYRLIDNHLEEMVRFRPSSKLVGPEIAIFRVPEDLWDRVVLEEATVESILDAGND